MKRFLFAVLLVALIAGCATAPAPPPAPAAAKPAATAPAPARTSTDVLVTANNHTDAIPMAQKPAVDEVQKTWFAKDRLRMDGAESGLLIRVDQKMMYIIDHKNKKASSAELPLDFAKIAGPEAAGQITQMLAAMKMTATTTPRDETKKIGTWTARRYDIAMTSAMGMKIDIAIWSTKDVPVDFAAYRDMMANMQGMNPSMADLVNEMKKIDGMAVLTDMTMNLMGTEVKTHNEVTSVEAKDAPPGTYEVPAGYAVEKLSLQGLMGGGH